MPEQTNYILYDPERTDYSVTQYELDRLEQGSYNLSKEVCLVSVSIGLPCLINAIHDTPTPFALTLALFLNYLVGILGIAFAIITGISWFKTRNRFSDVVQAIKKKPKMKIAVSSTGAQGGQQVAHAQELPPAASDSTRGDRLSGG